MKRGLYGFLPFLGFVVIIALWWGTVTWLHVPSYLLPSPRAVLNALYVGYVKGLFFGITCCSRRKRR